MEFISQFCTCNFLGGRETKATGARIIIIAWWMAIIMILAAYSGNLIAFLSITRSVIPFHSIAELSDGKKTAGFKWGTVAFTYYHDLFKV